MRKIVGSNWNPKQHPKSTKSVSFIQNNHKNLKIKTKEIFDGIPQISMETEDLLHKIRKIN